MTVKSLTKSSLALALSLLNPLPTFAAINLGNALKLTQGTESETVGEKYQNFGQIISAIVPNLLILASVILLFIIVGAGFTIVRSGGNPETTQKGKQALTGAIIGFVVIFAGYWSIQIIQIITGINILAPGF